MIEGTHVAREFMKVALDYTSFMMNKLGSLVTLNWKQLRTKNKIEINGWILDGLTKM